MKKMRGAIVEQTGVPLRVVDDLELDEPGGGEIRVRVSHCGVCHSDLSIVDGHMPYPLPAVLGHEAAGVVEKLGDGVNDIALGQRVVLSMRPPCGQCFYCQRNQPVLCVASATPAPGAPPAAARMRWRGQAVTRGLRLAAFAEYVVVERSGVVEIPEQVDSSVASVMGCAVQTGVGSVTNVARVETGANAAVFGLGGVGLSAIQGLHMAGAALIIGIDPNAGRRQSALSMGATHVFDSADEVLAEQVKSLTRGRGADYVFDTVANSVTTAGSIAISRPGGEIVLIGVPGNNKPLAMSAMDLVMKQRTVRGSFLGNCHPQRDMTRYFDLCCSGKLDLPALVTRTRPLEEINEAFDDLRNGTGIRTVITL